MPKTLTLHANTVLEHSVGPQLGQLRKVASRQVHELPCLLQKQQHKTGVTTKHPTTWCAVGTQSTAVSRVSKVQALSHT